MKAKYLFSMLAIGALFASCQKEALVTVPESTDGQLIEVGENFMITGVNSPDTKSQWVLEDGELMFNILPVATTAADNNVINGQNVRAREIGVCWLGNSVTSNVYTNYLFYHNGWLAAGEEEAVTYCSNLMNGWLYNEITGISPATIAAGVNVFPETAAQKGSFKAVDHDDFNLNSGVYYTDNLTMFGGDYIVYYPYDKTFTDAGSIPASSPLAFTAPFVTKANVAQALNASALAEQTFSYGYAPGLVGGDVTSGFETKNLSGIIQFNVKAAAGYTLTGKISKIALISEDGFISSVELDAAQIVAGATGEDLYVDGTEETSNAIVLTLETPTALAANGEYGCFVPALPTSVKNLKAVFYKDADGAEAAAIAMVDVAISDNAIVAGQGKVVSVTLANTNFNENSFLAVDEVSLRNAITAAVATNKNATVNILGDVALSAGLTIIPATNKVLTLKGGDIIVPHDVVLVFDANGTTGRVQMDNDVEVLGEPCCTTSNSPGVFIVTNSVLNGDVLILPEEPTADPAKAAGEMWVRSENTVTVNGEITNYGYLRFAASATNSVKTQMALKGSIVNNGIIAISKSLATEANSKLTVVSGGNIDNNGVIDVEGELVLSGTISNNAGARIIDYVSSQVTGSIAQLLDDAGDYISDVDDAGLRFDAALHARPTTILRFIGADNYKMTDANTHVSSLDAMVVAANGVVFTDDKGDKVADLSDIDLYVQAGLNVNIDNTPKKNTLGLTKITFKNVLVSNNAIMNIAGTNVKGVNSFIASDVVVAGSAGTDKANALKVGLGIYAQFASLTVNKAAKLGYFEIANNAQVDVLGQITVNGWATILKATGSTTNVAGIVWYPAAGPAPVGEQNWENGGPTQRLQ